MKDILYEVFIQAYAKSRKARVERIRAMVEGNIWKFEFDRDQAMIKEAIKIVVTNDILLEQLKAEFKKEDK